MKRIVILFSFLVIFCSCANRKCENKKQITKKEKSKIINKTYFKYEVAGVNHDDIINFIYGNNYVSTKYKVKMVSNEVQNKENIQEANDKTTDLLTVKEEKITQEIKDANTEIINEKPKEEVIEKEDDEIKEEKKEEITPIKKQGYYSPSGKYLGESKVKVVDVSYYQGNIDWNKFKNESDCYGVILRLGYYNTLDKMFIKNITALKNLNIPYGIYLFSYSVNKQGAIIESNFTNSMIDKYNIEPKLGIYYDIESWSSGNLSSNNISKKTYEEIIETYINNVKKHTKNNYKVKVYSGRWYAMNRLNNISKHYVDWVAEYNSTCKFDLPYSMWQYTSKGKVPGIIGNVDISYLY